MDPRRQNKIANSFCLSEFPKETWIPEKKTEPNIVCPESRGAMLKLIYRSNVAYYCCSIVQLFCCILGKAGTKVGPNQLGSLI